MKQRKVVSMIGALVLIMSVVAIMTGCQALSRSDSTSTNGGGANNDKHTKRYTISFDDSEIKCERNYSTINSGDEIKAGEQLSFQVLKLPENKIVDRWLVGKSVIKPNYYYRVNIADADDLGVIHISYRLRDIIKLKIIFDESKIKCEEKYGSADEIKSGTEVDESVYLRFTLTTPLLNKTVIWAVNRNDIWNGEFDELEYQVKPSDADEKKINITYTERDLMELIVRFDNNKIECIKISDGSKVLDGSKHLEKTKLKFKSIGGKRVKWCIGSDGSPRIRYGNKKSSFMCTLHSYYAAADRIFISYED